MKLPCAPINNITLAFDSFKGSLNSAEVADAFEEGLHTVLPHCVVRKVRIADGGEGTLEALIDSIGGKYETVIVNDPIGRPVYARYGIIEEGDTAVIELATASGLTLLSHEERNPMTTDTYGTGQLIAHALHKGCKNILLCIGGSATNDAGVGLLRALGYRFIDIEGNELIGGGEVLQHIHKIDDTQVLPQLSETQITVACDVDNPLWGTNGAAHIFAPQKGASPAMICELDNGLRHFANIIQQFNGKDVSAIPGGGAAGGVGAALVAFFNAQLKSGIDMVLDTIHFEDTIKDCDLIVTGEGKLDRQTLMGKAPIGILHRAKKHDIPVIAIGGIVEECAELDNCGFSSVICVNDSDIPLPLAMRHDIAFDNVRRCGIKVGLNAINGRNDCSS